MVTYLQEPNHGLETADNAKINAILERTHRHKRDCKQTSPMGLEGRFFRLRHVDDEQ